VLGDRRKLAGGLLASSRCAVALNRPGSRHLGAQE
jgi:hypothetical protein